MNVKNDDNECLKWALLSCKYPVKKNSDRVTSYINNETELNFTGVNFPTPLSQIPKVELQNNLGINVFGYSESAGIHPLYITKDNDKSPINLLLISEVKDGKRNSHWCWIKDFNRLCHDQTKHANRKHFCLRCISPHSSERTLQDHLVYCRGVDAAPCHAVFPQATEDGSPPTIQFKNIQHMMKAPYVIYADTESIVKPADSPNTDTNTVQTSEHIPCSFAYTVVRSDGRVKSEKLYRGEDCMDVFFDWLDLDLAEIREDLKKRTTASNERNKTGQYTAQPIHVGFAVVISNRTSKATPKVYGKCVTMITWLANIAEQRTANVIFHWGLIHTTRPYRSFFII